MIVNDFDLCLKSGQVVKNISIYFSFSFIFLSICCNLIF